MSIKATAHRRWISSFPCSSPPTFRHAWRWINPRIFFLPIHDMDWCLHFHLELTEMWSSFLLATPGWAFFSCLLFRTPVPMLGRHFVLSCVHIMTIWPLFSQSALLWGHYFPRVPCFFFLTKLSALLNISYKDGYNNLPLPQILRGHCP